MKSFKEFFFSPMGILCIPVFIIIFVLLSNVDVVMERMGFETRTHLKSELTKTKYTLNVLQKSLTQLKAQQIKMSNYCQIKEDLTNDFVNESENIDKYIKDVISKNIYKTPLIRTELVETSDSDDDESSVDHVVILNNDNIVAINKVYNEFFGG